MILTRCSDQKRQTLEEFYGEVSSSGGPVVSRIGATMLSLMDRLREHPSPRRIFGLTSHYRLCLLAADAYDSPWFVMISVLDPSNYAIEYLMPESQSPWLGGAYVKGEARSEADAMEMILIAMEKSEGWRD